MIRKATREELNAMLDKAEAERDKAKTTIDQFWEHLSYSYEVEGREELEAEANSWNPPNALVVALHYIWKREPKVASLTAALEKIKNSKQSGSFYEWVVALRKIAITALAPAKCEDNDLGDDHIDYTTKDWKCKTCGGSGRVAVQAGSFRMDKDCPDCGGD